ncbi:hypothetical protein DFJ73DRAFT_958993 [Zopfochytrium polystomum]|nr:hypothetical protein DFJ73DRAFT_958993 [Zopfochytrium polystomum]
MYSAAPPAAVATPAASTARRRGHQPAAHAAAAAASSIRPTRSAHRPLLLLLPIALLLFLVVLLASSVALAAPLPFAAATVPDDALHSAAANTAALERRSFLKKLKHAMHKVGHGLEQAGKGVAKGVTHGAQAILKKVENATPVTRGITNLAKTGINAGKAIAHHENIKTIAKGVGKGLLKTAKESIPNGRDLKTIKTLTSFTPAGKLVAAGIGAASTVASIGKGIAQHKNVKTILKDAGKTAANAALDSIPGGGIAKKAITAAETVQKVADKAHH